MTLVQMDNQWCCKQNYQFQACACCQHLLVSKCAKHVQCELLEMCPACGYAIDLYSKRIVKLINWLNNWIKYSTKKNKQRVSCTHDEQICALILPESVPRENADPLALLSEPNLSSSACNDQRNIQNFIKNA